MKLSEMKSPVQLVRCTLGFAASLSQWLSSFFHVMLPPSTYKRAKIWDPEIGGLGATPNLSAGK